MLIFATRCVTDLSCISETIKEHRLWLAGHCWWSNEAAANLVLWKPQHGQKKPRRPKLDYATLLSKDTAFNFAELDTTTSSREWWQTVVMGSGLPVWWWWCITSSARAHTVVVCIVLLWPWPWANDLDILSWPLFSEDVSAYQKRTLCHWWYCLESSRFKCRKWWNLQSVVVCTNLLWYYLSCIVQR